MNNQQQRGSFSSYPGQRGLQTQQQQQQPQQQQGVGNAFVRQPLVPGPPQQQYGGNLPPIKTGMGAPPTQFGMQQGNGMQAPSSSSSAVVGAMSRFPGGPPNPPTTGSQTQYNGPAHTPYGNRMKMNGGAMVPGQGGGPPPPMGMQRHGPPPPPPVHPLAPQTGSGVATNGNNVQQQVPPPFSIASPSKPVAQKTIDPSQMPRPATNVLPTQVFETRKEGTHSVPPASDVALAVIDTGNAGPRFMRASMNSVPQGNDMVKSSSIPFVFAVQPLALQSKGDSGIPLIDERDQGPLRCSSCNAYACPYMKFSPDGSKMTCCFCGGATPVPPEHIGPVGMEGRRTDGRPAFDHGTVEYIVSGKYQIREPMLPTYVFMIDCTAEAIESGMTATVCSSISALVGSISVKERSRAAIITFSSSIHFYEFRQGGNGDPKMLVVGDLDDPFCPSSSAIFASLDTQLDSLKGLLERIPKMYQGAMAAESAAGAAIQACIETLKYAGGGRLLSFIASLPHKGLLSLRPRESGKPPSEKEALDIMTPVGNGKHYAEVARDAAQHNVSIDVFALTKSYVDLATLGVLSHYTSGSVYRYSPFSYVADSVRFYDDLRWNLTRPIGFEGVGRMRVSSGLAVEEVIGAYSKSGQTDLQFPVITSDSTLCVKVVHEERLREGSQACVQFAILYSSPSGQRRVRVHSMALPVTRSLGSVFRGADLEVYMAYLARKVSMSIPGKSLSFVRDLVNKSVVGTLLAYRKHCASSSSSGQLILPESLKLMPLFCLGLMKLPCFRTDARADARAVWMSRICSLPIDRLLPAVHPRFFKMPLDVQPQGNPENLMCQRLPLSAEHLESNEIYMLENGFDLFVQVGRDVPAQQMQQLLGGPLDGIDPSAFADLPNQDNPLSKQSIQIISHLRRQRRSYMHMRLVVKGHPHETLFHSALIEDRHVLSGMSYVEYLCFLHRQIQNKMS